MIELVQNDTRPDFIGRVEFDLSGYEVEMHIAFQPVLIKAATILTTDPSESTFKIEFATGDLDVPVGTYKWELQFDDGDNGITTYKKDSNGEILKFKILEEIA